MKSNAKQLIDKENIIDDRSDETLAEIAERLIKEMIRSSQLNPGDRLSEPALAKQLGVSRGPIREALRRLEGAGLIAVVPAKGMCVREISLKEILDAFELRAVILAYAAEQAAEFISPDRIAELTGLVVAMENAMAASSADAYYEANLAFHDTILRYSNNARARHVYAELIKELQLFRRKYFDFVGGMRSSTREHRALLEAIAAGDMAQSRALALAHVKSGRDRVLKTIDMPGH